MKSKKLKKQKSELPIVELINQLESEKANLMVPVMVNGLVIDETSHNRTASLSILMQYSANEINADSESFAQTLATVTGIDFDLTHLLDVLAVTSNLLALKAMSTPECPVCKEQRLSQIN